MLQVSPEVDVQEENTDKGRNTAEVEEEQGQSEGLSGRGGKSEQS